MSVTITIKTASLLSDIKVRSHMIAERLKEPMEQYSARVGEENESVAKQAVQDAWRSLKAICRPFLATTNDNAGNDQLVSNLTTVDQTLTFDVTARRTSQIGEPLAQEMHEYLVAGALRRFYSSAMLTDVVSIAAASENVAKDNIIRILRYKGKPTYI